MRKNFQEVDDYSVFIMNIIGYINTDGKPQFVFDRNIQVDINGGKNVHIVTNKQLRDALANTNFFTITRTLFLVDKNGSHIATPCNVRGTSSDDTIEYAPVTKAPYLKPLPYVIECELEENRSFDAYAKVVNVSVDYAVLDDYGEVFNEVYSFKNTLRLI